MTPAPGAVVTRQLFQTRVSKCGDPNEIIAAVKGERFREYRRRFHASGRGELMLDYPLDLSIETVDYCNYRCPYCPRVDEPGSGARIEEDLFKRLIDEFAERTQGLAAVCFDRGEPMLDRHLEDKVRYVHEKGIVDIILTTNGVYLTPERSRKLIEAGLTKLHVSLDAATQETYTKTRGGVLAKVEEYIEGFLRVREQMSSRLPVVRCSFVVAHGLNDHEVDQFRERWAPVVEYVEFQDCVDHSRVDDLRDFPVKPFFCHYPFQSVAITAKGEMLPCCSFYAKHLVFGDAAKDSIGAVFNSERQQKLRRSFLEQKDYDPVCKNCRCTPDESQRSA